MVVGCQPYAPAAFTPRKYSWYSFLLEAESTPGPICGRKDFMSMKNPLTPAGIEPATFWFVAQHLNHCTTAVPQHKWVPGIFPEGVKGCRCVGLTIISSWADCHEIWEPQPPGTLRACPEFTLPLLDFFWMGWDIFDYSKHRQSSLSDLFVMIRYINIPT